MNVRISKSLVAAALALPLLAGCGASTEAAPAASSAPATTAASSSAPAASASPAPTAEPQPTTDPAADKKAAADASEKFVKTALTIGYPDKDVDTYADRVKPLMTSGGFKNLFGGDSRASASKAVKQLSGKRARTTPKLAGTTKVGQLTDEKATATVSFRNVAQLRDGDGWKTLKTSEKQSSTIRLVKQDEKWLVDAAS